MQSREGQFDSLMTLP
nr:unnamed protein product [Callosobruchus chinensis]